MAASQSEDKRPQRDPAEDNAFFPSPYSLGQFTKPNPISAAPTIPIPIKARRRC